MSNSEICELQKVLPDIIAFEQQAMKKAGQVLLSLLYKGRAEPQRYTHWMKRASQKGTKSQCCCFLFLLFQAESTDFPWEYRMQKVKKV